MGTSNLLSLLQLSDPALPIGGFAHSSGLETYVQHGIVSNVDTAKEFIVSFLAQNLHYTDAALASLAYNDAMQNELENIIEWDVICTAIKLPAQIRDASQKLGLRLLKIFQPVSDQALVNHYQQAVQSKRASGNYCIVFGLFAASLKIPKADALAGFYFNAAAGMVTNCVKLVPLGQQDGQQLLFGLQPVIQELVLSSLEPDISKIGFSCAGFDIRCMQHEQLYSRLYMS